MNQSGGSNGRFGGGQETDESMNDEYIDVGDGTEFYESVQTRSAGSQQQQSYQPMIIPKMEYQQPSSTSYYVQRVPQQLPQQPVPFGTPGGRSQASSSNVDFSSLDIKSTVLRPANVYSRPSNVLNTRIAGLPQSILASSLSTGKPKQKKGQTNKKHCNCTKSQCLKLYCDCFANGEFCSDCNCKDCHNNLQNENERSRAIKNALDRNPKAFNPKIGVASKIGKSAADLERLHQKGCHCKKSNCLKNYCECYEAKVPCTDRCKCTSCRNTEEDRSVNFKDKFNAKTLAQLAASAANKNRDGTPESEEDDQDGIQEEQDPKTQPWFYMSDEVIEATTMCLVSYVQEVENRAQDEQPSMEEVECSLLKEFSRCIGQIVESAKDAKQNRVVRQ